MNRYNEDVAGRLGGSVRQHGAVVGSPRRDRVHADVAVPPRHRCGDGQWSTDAVCGEMSVPPHVQSVAIWWPRQHPSSHVEEASEEAQTGVLWFAVLSIVPSRVFDLPGMWHAGCRLVQAHLERLQAAASGRSKKHTGKIAASMQHTLTRLQLSVKQGRAGVVSQFQKSRSGVNSIRKKVFKGVRQTFTRKRTGNGSANLCLLPLYTSMDVRSMIVSRRWEGVIVAT